MNQKYNFLFLLIFFTSLIMSCQEESVVIVEPPLEDAFTSNSQVANVVGKVTSLDGSNDNIISGGSCISFVLPVTVIVNGEELIIESDDDLSLVEYIIDEFEDDDDEIVVIFPVTIILPDYTRVEINSGEELESYTDECEEGGIDDDIECVDFRYPLQISTYDTENQVSNIVTIGNDEQLYLFLRDQDDDILMSFVFPLTLIYPDGSEMIVNNHDQLEDALEEADNMCDEDDDNDFDDDDVDTSNFRSTLLTGSWIISSYIDSGENETGDFSGWIFTFSEEGRVIATKENEEVSGEWITSGDDGIVELELFFPEETLFIEISEDWDVTQFNSEKIDLEDDGEDFLVFEKN